MLDSILRTARAALAFAAIIGAPLAMSGTALGATPSEDMAQAKRLLESGQVVEARDLLVEARRDATGEERERVFELLASADERLRHMTEIEISLQKARLALDQGDLRRADMQATAVLRATNATDAEQQLASSLLDESARVRDELAPMVAPALEQAVKDYNAGEYAEAKAGLESVSRTGVRLSAEQSSTLRRYRERIYELERDRGAPYEMEYVPLGVLNSAGGQAVGAVTLVAMAAQDAQETSGNQPQSGDEMLDDVAPRVDAQRTLVEADTAFDAGRYAEARSKYLQVTTKYAQYLTDEQVAQAQSRLQESQARLGAATGDMLGREVEQRSIILQQVEAEVDNLKAQARAALAAGDFESARRVLAEAQLKWNELKANGLVSDERYRKTADELRTMLDQVEQTQRDAIKSKVEQEGAKVRTEQAGAQATALRQQQQRVNESLDRLRQLTQEQKYAEALQVCEEVLFLDPTNPAAQLMQDILQDLILYRQDFDIQRRKSLSFARESNAISEAMVIPQSELAFPPDWPEISLKRGQVVSFAESPQDRRVYAALDSRRMPARFQDSPLQDVLSFVATVTNLNFDIDWDSLEQIGVEKDSRVSLELSDVAARVVLDRVLQKASIDEFNRASWAVQDGIVVVSSDDKLRKNTFIVIYDVRDLLFQVNNYDQVPELDLDAAIQQGGQGGGGGGGSIFEDNQEDQELPTEAEQLDQLLEIIQTNVDFEGWRDNGGDTGIVQTLNNNLIITNTAKNHREIQALLDKLREVRSLQITVETRILQVSTDFFERIGFDVDLYFNGNTFQDAALRQVQAFGLGSLANEGTTINYSNLVGTDGTNAAPGYVITGIDQNTGLPIYTFGQGATATPYTIPAPGQGGTSNLSTIPVQQNSDAITQTLIESLSSFAQSIGQLNPALAVAGTFLDDVQVDFLIEATQADQRSVELNAPRLTFMNGRAANISVGRQQAYVSALTPVVGTAAAGFDPTVSTLNTGFSLLLQGVVSADRRYVTMNAEITTAELIQFTPQSVSLAVGGAAGSIGGGVVTDVFQVPEVLTTRVRTGLTIPDQGTALLGGQRVATEIDVESGVPVLSKIPIINRFFTNTATVKSESTLLILLKPRILIQSEQEDELFPGLSDQMANPYGF